MDPALKIWALIAIVGALNYASRLSFIAFFARRSVPPLLARALRYVPAAMLTALIVPMILPRGADGALAPAVSPHVAATALAGVAAYFTRSTLATIGVGMAALWLARTWM